MNEGTQMTLARVSSASATQTPAWAAATTSGRASESRSAAARLIGNRRSLGSNGAGFSVMSKAREFGRLGDGPPLGAGGEVGKVDEGHRPSSSAAGTAGNRGGGGKGAGGRRASGS